VPPQHRLQVAAALFYTLKVPARLPKNSAAG